MTDTVSVEQAKQVANAAIVEAMTRTRRLAATMANKLADDFEGKNVSGPDALRAFANALVSGLDPE